MGRPYESELAELRETYAWSMATSPESLATSLASAVRLPLISVGSGGSLTSASVAALLHMRFTGAIARTMTPYDIAMSPLSLNEIAVLLCSAGGSNPDILSCFEGLVRREPALLAAVCTRRNSPLAKAAAARDWTFCHEFAAPIRKDGFLATNSLLATTILLMRAYEHIFSVPPSLPGCLAELLHPGEKAVSFWTKLEQEFRPLCERRTFTVLHGHTTQPAAADMESRLTEAALANVQLADYRNFAHGRHHWLARKAEETALLMLSTPEDQAAADRTASLLPKSIPVLRLGFPQGLPGMLSAVVHSIHLGWFAAKTHRIDPGRPKVAQFGRRLYHIRSIPKSPPTDITVPELEACAIERKSGLTIATLHARNNLHTWRTYYRTFLNALAATTFHGVIFDYDGTLCGSAERFTGLRKEVIAHLLSLLRAGIAIGIATGRGRSVREALRSQIRQRRHHKQVVIGYHNAAEIALLDDDTTPPAIAPLDESLVAIDSLLERSHLVSMHSRKEAKGQQITLETSAAIAVQNLWDTVSEMVRRHGDRGLQIVRSTHSIDILARGVSKQSLLMALTERLGSQHRDPAVLCIGDRGRWPGNDFALLEHPHALSVDETSHDPATCWNLAPPSTRHVDACLHYLDRFELDSETFQLRGLGGRT